MAVSQYLIKNFLQNRKLFLCISKLCLPLHHKYQTSMDNNTLPTLYKRDATGGIRMWRVVVDGDRYWTEHGLVDGVKTCSDVIYAQPKNVGRSNETTAETQATLEAASMWRKAKEQNGYWENIADIDKKLYEPPMLANTYDGNYKGFMKFEQPKLDGIRCNISRLDDDTLEAISRKGKPFHTLEHITRALLPYLPYGVHLDGELYNHELYDDFNQIVSLVKKQKPTKEDLLKARQLVQYHVYDVWIDDRPNMPFSERMELLQLLLGDIDADIVTYVETREVSSHNDIREWFEYFTNKGYEGAIIRSDGAYNHKRCNNLLKYKEFKSDEFEVLDICEGRAGSQAEYAIIRLNDGSTCKATIAASDEECMAMLANKDMLIGSKATIKFFGYTPAGKLRFPVLQSFRDYE